MLLNSLNEILKLKPSAYRHSYMPLGLHPPSEHRTRLIKFNLSRVHLITWHYRNKL